MGKHTGVVEGRQAGALTGGLGRRLMPRPPHTRTHTLARRYINVDLVNPKEAAAVSAVTLTYTITDAGLPGFPE